MNVLQAFEKCNNLWEDTAVLDRPSTADDMLAYVLNKTKPTVIIKGQPHEFVTPFLPIDKLCTKEFARPGIYIWRSEYSNAYYVGQAVDIQKRTKTHSNAPVRDSKKLHNAIRVHGTSAFTAAVIEFCSAAKKELNRLEVEWIAKLNTFWDRHDFNLTPGGEGGSGGTLTLDDFKVLAEQLRQTGPDALDFTELGRYWGYERSNIHKMNLGDLQYIREYGEELGITFPIRQEEYVGQVGHDRQREKNPQSKLWNLVVTYGRLNERGRYEEVGKEILGTFTGHENAWRKIVEIEKAKYGTSDEELLGVKGTFNKSNQSASANIDKLSDKHGAKGARRYTLEPVE
jgi:predicted GIY-YIG superfamily endonuclease